MILASEMGSSVMKSTRSRLTLAKRRISLKSNVQYCLIERPSTLDRSPPDWKKFNFGLEFSVLFLAHGININVSYREFAMCSFVNLPKIHCLPGMASTNGLHLVKTSLASKSCSVSNGLPSPSGSIMPSLTVISR